MSGDSVTAQDLLKALSSPETLRENSFEVLRDLCSFASTAETVTAQDMLLRALEVRDQFGGDTTILDGLVREFGLFPYLNPENLPISDLIAYEAHRPPHLSDDIVFHRPQAEVYWSLVSGDNVVLSAPTSFGKSLIIDAIIASGRFDNVLIVVPTIALIDETRRRLAVRFRGAFKVITHGSQSRSKRNIFVATQERVLEDDLVDQIDFFVIDEFYKLSPSRQGDDRCALLNQLLYKLLKRTRQFYMLGPNVLGVSPDFAERVKYKAFYEPYRTVVSELHHVEGPGTALDRLVRLCKSLQDPTLIFCSSPTRAMTIAKTLIASELGESKSACDEAADWIATHYHPDWHFCKALRRGVGVHHGRIPRALAQFAVRAFDEGDIKFLICTSTLIEGVNTKAKNIIIFDHQIQGTPIDLFTFNNIRGRAGRMRRHFVGHVYLFHPEPEQELPLVEMPVFSQSDDVPESLLIQIDDEDLSSGSKERLKPFLSQKVLKIETLKQNVGIDPQAQLNLAREIADNVDAFVPSLQWSGFPSYPQVEQICNLIWRHFNGGDLAAESVKSAKHLAFLINQLRRAVPVKTLIDTQIEYWNDPDVAVQKVLDFLRLWANFHFPRFLRGLDRIQSDIFTRRGIAPGSYDFFAGQVENYFLDSGLVALDEYGVPLELARKLGRLLAAGGDLDLTLAKLKQLDVSRLNLSNFEKNLVVDAQSGL